MLFMNLLEIEQKQNLGKFRFVDASTKRRNYREWYFILDDDDIRIIKKNYK